MSKTPRKRKPAPTARPAHHRVPSFSTTMADARRAAGIADWPVDTTPLEDAFERQNGLGYSPGGAAAFIPGSTRWSSPAEFEAELIKHLWMPELKAIKPKEKPDRLVEVFTRFGTVFLIIGVLVAGGVLALALYGLH